MVLPLCRCRVLYIGSAVPTVTKDGLQGIQQPLRERYPVEDTPETRGIDSWLSVWSNGILLEYIEGDKKSESAFFPINTLHYCASVRYVNVTGYAVEGGGERFLPLDSPFADIPDSPHPPIFAAILRRTTGVKVLECHGFICSNAKAANALVRCCFHAYADCMYLKLDEKIPNLKAIKEGSTGERSPASPNSDEDISVEADDHTDRRMHGWERRQQEGEYDSVSISSSLLRNNKAASENGARHHALVPFESSPRRAGSDADLTASFRGDPRMMPPFMPPPPHHRMPPPGMFPPPPFMRPPPHFAGGPGGPHMPPPHFFPPPPPHMMRGGPPHPMFWGPPPPPRGFFHPPPFGGMPPFRPPSPGEGPIITGPESVYGTMRRSAYEEPAYVASGGPPESSYQPSSYPPEQYEAYYDTLKKGKGSKKGSVTSKDVWEQYEAGIYRKPHINEKAFSNTLRETAEKDTMNTTLRRKDETSTQTATADVLRPDTPPADYEVRNGGAVRAH